MSRALSVHQGKGLSDEQAQIGALLEAVESDLAERFDVEGPTCRWSDLPAASRASDVTDFANNRAVVHPGDAPVRWVQATTFTGNSLYVPFDAVSLDLSANLDSVFERSSNGIATGGTIEAALLAALCEVIERDAILEWREWPMLARLRCHLDTGTIPYPWFAELQASVRTAGAWLTCFVVPTPVGLPVLVCEIADYGKASVAYAASWGSGSHACPETALLRAVGEALQTRVTLIAGAREDFLPSAYSQPGRAGFAFGPPPPPGWNSLDWASISPKDDSAEAIAERVHNAGFGPAASIVLGEAEGYSTVRAFAPGLAGLNRRRRVPA